MHGHTVSDLEINCSVRKVLVRHQVNLGWLAISTCRGAVCVQGDLLLLPGLESTLTPETVGAIFDQIERCAGVCRVSEELQNWHRGSLKDGWKPVEKAAVPKSRHGKCPAPNATVFDITDEWKTADRE